MQFLSLNSLNRYKIFGQFSFSKTESEHNFGFAHIPIVNTADNEC